MKTLKTWVMMLAAAATVTAMHAPTPLEARAQSAMRPLAVEWVLK